MTSGAERQGRFVSPPGLRHRFEVEIGAGEVDSVYAVWVRMADRDGRDVGPLAFVIRAHEHESYLDFFASLARHFGTRTPLNRMPSLRPGCSVEYVPLLTENLGTGIRYGYGDPAVLRFDGWYYLVVTSNDAPDAFPILRSRDLHEWEPRGFLFPEGQTPGWAATGEGIADYWAPEIHKVGDGFRACFVARRKDDLELCIGLASASHPEGPWLADAGPILDGNQIDPHLFVASDGGTYLYWKEDNNGVWPDLLSRFLHGRPEFVERLFDVEADIRTASLMAALWPWIGGLSPMERFFMQQPLIEAVRTRFAEFRNRLAELTGTEDIVNRLRTPFCVQRLSEDGKQLVGQAQLVLENDHPWESHVIEGMWVVERSGQFYMFYAGNDFSTDDYGIGLAVSDSPTGPFRKMAGPLLGSSAEWSGPGHPSVASDPAGRDVMFLHAYRPGAAAYGEFRALLMVEFEFRDGVFVVRGSEASQR
ncbi:MAG: hypothetical protein JWN34_5233 [Bryobacterales bacterium]|nr:hypothetical protein [Bryobacterales bacterium]